MAQIRRILIANRGEIAVRVIRSCRSLGIETVLAVSEADRDTLGAKLATQSVCIGPSRATESYLKIDTIIHTALAANCDAIHPGYGFLSENSALADACREHGLIFIGPSPEQLEAVGDKLIARRHAEAAGVPLVPGGSVASLDEAATIAETIGFPLLVKAVAGGGGRGMKRVDHVEQLGPTLDLAIAEASAAFGDGRVYLERFVSVGRHVEVQILSDGDTILHVGERDCSVQRRYQKLVEEAPAPRLSQTLRRGLHEAALAFARHIQYRSLGTVEFLVDVEREAFYFLEMNARIQVEHPVTEAISGLDLVALQIKIAEGTPLPLAQDDIVLDGHALECRLNAEDIQADFRPAPGRVTQVWFPSLPGLRVDTHMQAGAMISPFYDSMVCKLIAWGKSREQAIDTMLQALRISTLEGIATNAALHQAILSDASFREGGVDTNYLARLLPKVLNPVEETP